MDMQTEAMIIKISPQVLPVLEGMTGETPEQKIALLLLDKIRYYLEESERERLGLEIKYGLEYADFQQQLEAGELGDEFGYDLEMDALRWGDLIAEKKHWLQQLNLLKGSLE